MIKLGVPRNSLCKGETDSRTFLIFKKQNLANYE